MTRRERLERRLERRLRWAEGREAKAQASFAAVHRIADNIPLGQPILVGHHSERHARRDQDRIHNGMARGVEHEKMAHEHSSKADGLERILDTAIFSDDPDAPERIRERIAEIEAKRDKLKAINAAFRKGKGEPGWSRHLGPERMVWEPGEDPIEKAWAALKASCPWERKPVASYQLSNLSGNIGRLRKRLEAIEARATHDVAVEAAGGAVIRERDGLYRSVEISFSDKPPREIINELKAAGFWWASGSWWGGQTARVPDLVRNYVERVRGA